MKNKTGEQNNAVFGMASMLISILKAEEPDAFLICFDEGDETFRHEEHDEYKEGRAETPDDFYAQIPRIMELVRAFGFHSVSDKAYEADDFLCTYAHAGREEGYRVTVVSGDRDLLQIATDDIVIAIPHKGYQQTEYLRPDDIEAKYGIRPEQVPDYKGLCGDSSDNLPGVHGIGPKTASELLQEFHTLDNLYDNLGSVRPKIREKLEADRDQAFFCRRMAELVCDIPLPYEMQQLRLEGLETEPVMDFFSEMNFTMLTKRFQQLLTTDYGRQAFTVTEQSLITPTKSAPDQSQLSLFL